MNLVVIGDTKSYHHNNCSGRQPLTDFTGIIDGRIRSGQSNMRPDSKHFHISIVGNI
jgi:hypothetical protein